MRTEGCRDIVFIGAMVRPALSEIRLDWGTLRALPTIASALRGGDDHLLSGIGRLFEQAGFRLLGIRDVAPELLMPEGSITQAMPDADAAADIAWGPRPDPRLSPFPSGRPGGDRPHAVGVEASRAPTRCWRGWRNCAGTAASAPGPAAACW